MYFKSYENIETAIKNYRNDYYLKSNVKVRCVENIHKDERTLIDAAILCKVLKTFYEHFDELKRNYNIEHVSHLFWHPSTYQLKYNSSRCCFEVHSGSPNNQADYIQYTFGDQVCDEGDIRIYANYINAFIDLLFEEMKVYAPIAMYDSIREHILNICRSE